MTIPFIQSKAGIKWHTVTGRSELNAAFNSDTYDSKFADQSRAKRGRPNEVNTLQSRQRTRSDDSPHHSLKKRDYRSNSRSRSPHTERSCKINALMTTQSHHIHNDFDTYIPSYDVVKNNIVLPAVICITNTMTKLLINVLPDTGAASNDYVSEDTAAWLKKQGQTSCKCEGDICSGVGDSMCTPCTPCLDQYHIEIELMNDLIEAPMQIKNFA